MIRRAIDIRTLLPAVLAAAGAAALSSGRLRAEDAPADPPASKPSPFVRIYDTGKLLEDLREHGTVKLDPAWPAVPHKKRDHLFAGDAVVLNDKVGLILLSDHSSAHIFAAGTGLRHCRAALDPGSDPERVEPVAATWKIVENTPAAVAVELTRKGGKGLTDTTRFRLTMGSPLVEVRYVRGVCDCGVYCLGAEQLLACDYFAGDVASVPGQDRLRGIGPPIDNAFVALYAAGGALLACMWTSPGQGAYVILDGDEPFPKEGVNVDLRSGQSLWVAVLEGKDIWQPRWIVGDGSRAKLGDGPKPPFPARWRRTAVRPGKSGLSWPLGDPLPGGAKPGERVAIYPLERTRKTPLTALCVTDLMRRALGVGPCQYVLDAEGLAGDVPATADAVTRWLTRLVQRGRAKTQAEEIRRRLAAMKAHFAAMDRRIGEYLRAARDLRTRCAKPQGGEKLQRVAEILTEILDETVTEASAYVKASPSVEAAKLADGLADLVGKEGAAERLAAACAKLRALGARQDRALGRCRQGLRRVRAFCFGYVASAVAGDKDGDFAMDCHKRAGAVLKPKRKKQEDAKRANQR